MQPAGTRSMATLTLGEIAASLPGASDVLRRHKLDFWCGGSQRLDQAARRQGLDPAAIAAELAGLAPQDNPVPDGVDDIINHILERYHQVHRRELPRLRKLATYVEQVHAGHRAVPAGLSELLARMQAQLESHMDKEEQVLFPLMRAGGNPMIVHPIAMMRHKHDDHAAALGTLAAITGDLNLPDDADDSWRVLYAGLGQMVEDLSEHMHIENNILFPRFEA